MYIARSAGGCIFGVFQYGSNGRTMARLPQQLGYNPYQDLSLSLLLPIGSSRMVYMLTKLGYIDGQWQTIYSIHTDHFFFL